MSFCRAGHAPQVLDTLPLTFRAPTTARRELRRRSEITTPTYPLPRQRDTLGLRLRH